MVEGAAAGGDVLFQLVVVVGGCGVAYCFLFCVPHHPSLSVAFSPTIAGAVPVLPSTQPTIGRNIKLGESKSVTQEHDPLHKLFYERIDARSDDSSRTWGMVAIGALALAAIGSVGTFARVSRTSLASPTAKAIMARQAAEAASSGLASVQVLERRAEQAVLRARLAQLKARQAQRHPLWHPEAAAELEVSAAAAAATATADAGEAGDRHPDGFDPRATAVPGLLEARPVPETKE